MVTADILGVEKSFRTVSEHDYEGGGGEDLEYELNSENSGKKWPSWVVYVFLNMH